MSHHEKEKTTANASIHHTHAHSLCLPPALVGPSASLLPLPAVGRIASLVFGFLLLPLLLRRGGGGGAGGGFLLAFRARCGESTHQPADLRRVLLVAHQGATAPLA